MVDHATAAPAAALDTPLDAALEQIGDRWSLRIVSVLLEGPRRFGELAAAVPGIAPNVLADRLRRLARAGIVVARPYERRPVRYEYALTAEGADLAGAIRALAAWGARRGGGGEGGRHAVCGTPVELRAWCPTCREVVEEPSGASREEVRL
jgi:DNA-binding HxlR family transcriptional regulator